MHLKLHLLVIAIISNLGVFIIFWVLQQRDCQTIGTKVLEKVFNILFRVFGHVFTGHTHFPADVLNGVLTIEVLPYKYTCRIKSEGISCSWIKEDSPVVKFFSEDYQRISYGLCLRFHGCAASQEPTVLLKS